MLTSQIRNSAVLAAALFLPVSTLLAQSHRTVKGNLSPMAQSQNDLGPVEPTKRLGYISVMLKRTAQQQASLDQLLEQQQDPNSPLYHQWLTPEQFADRFGASQQDIDQLTKWLVSSGFSLAGAARGRDYIVFSGTASQVENALHTSIHYFKADDRKHYANAAEPEVPKEFADLVAGFRGLNDFVPKPRKHQSVVPPVRVSGPVARPMFIPNGANVNVLAPDDLAAIYNVGAYFKAGFDGTGQTIAIAGSSAIDPTDIATFRSFFNLPPNTPKTVLVPGAQDPGMNDAMTEADLDIEWAGAIARNATIVYVYADDPFTASIYAIDQAVAPVLNGSFGICEWRITQSEAQTLAAEAQKAVSEGITWVVASGDSGAAACEDQNGAYTSAITRMSVPVPASIPYVTAVGGTEFNDSNGNYWSSAPGPNGGTASGYIPEGGWSDEAFIARNNLFGFAASGGGASIYFSKPSWQTGPGVPNDGARDVPDVALTTSPFHDPYTVVGGGSFFADGGTSAAAPVFSGIVALLNEYLVKNGKQSQPGLGNINPVLYSLAQTAPTVFHDITTGNNIVPCVKNSTQDCTTGSMGYSAGPGYDMVTGLGSVDAYNLALDWKAPSSGSSGTSQPSQTAHLVITTFTASASVKVGGAFNPTFTVVNQGATNAPPFENDVFFTSNGDLSTAKEFYISCNFAKGLPAGQSGTCSGAVNLDNSITAGSYILVVVADSQKVVPESDRSGGTVTAKLTVTQ